MSLNGCKLGGTSLWIRTPMLTPRISHISQRRICLMRKQLKPRKPQSRRSPRRIRRRLRSSCNRSWQGIVTYSRTSLSCRTNSIERWRCARKPTVLDYAPMSAWTQGTADGLRRRAHLSHPWSTFWGANLMRRRQLECRSSERHAPNSSNASERRTKSFLKHSPRQTRESNTHLYRGEFLDWIVQAAPSLMTASKTRKRYSLRTFLKKARPWIQMTPTLMLADTWTWACQVP